MPQSLFLLIEIMAQSIHRTSLRALALSRLLVDRGVISGEDLDALMQEMDEVSDLEVEVSDSPEHVAWRELRRTVRQMQTEEPPGDEPGVDPPRTS